MPNLERRHKITTFSAIMSLCLLVLLSFSRVNADSEVEEQRQRLLDQLDRLDDEEQIQELEERIRQLESQMQESSEQSGGGVLEFPDNAINESFSSTAQLNERILSRRSSSSLFRECQSLLADGETWIKVTTKDTSNTQEIWESAWKEFRHTWKDELLELEGEVPNKLVDFYDRFNRALKERHDYIAKCEAMRAITAYSGMDEDSLKSGSSATQKSVDGKVVCKSAGPETQDYKKCLTALDAYNAALVGTAVFTQAQTVKYQGDSAEAAGSLNPNDPTSALKAQKKNIEGQASMTQQRAGLDVVKAAGLGALLMDMPTPKTLKKYCNNQAGSAIKYRSIRTEFEATKDLFYGINLSQMQTTNIQLSIPGNLNEPNGQGNVSQNLINILKGKKSSLNITESNVSNQMQRYCGEAVESTNKLIVNTPAKDAIKNAAIAAGVDGVKHKLTADQLNKQADQVGRIINEVDDFNPEELPQFQGQDFQGSECALDPSAEGCDDFVNERSFGFQDRGPLQIHGMENASNFSRGNEPRSRGDEDSGAGVSTDRSGAPKPIGIIDPKVANKSGFDGRMPGAADVSSDGPAAGGGGGGGGGAPGGGGSPPPSQVPQQKQGNDGPRMSDAGNSRAGYSGGGGSLRRSGGRGAMGRGSRDEGDDGNPFSELFGDKDPTKSETLNFRDTASADNQINTPDTSIFEIISDRYANVQQEDRLLEYEVQDPDKLQ